MSEWMLSGRRGGKGTGKHGTGASGGFSCADPVHLNQASPRQVVALLRLTPGEAWEILRARPLRSAEALIQLVPEASLPQPVSLLLERLPLNDAREVELIHLAGLSPAQAARVCAGRPYPSEQALEALPSLSRQELARLLEIFKVSGGHAAQEDTLSSGEEAQVGASNALRRKGSR